MAGLNTCTLIGNLGRDPELRSVGDGGTSMLRFSLATSERYKSRDGEWQETTQWHQCTVWGNRADGLSRILAKGSRICVLGSIEYRKYEQDGVEKWSTGIKVRDVVLLGESGGGGGGARPRQSAMSADADPFDDDEIQF